MSNKAERFVNRTFEEQKKNWNNKNSFDAFLATVKAVKKKLDIDWVNFKKIPPEYDKALEDIKRLYSWRDERLI